MPNSRALAYGKLYTMCKVRAASARFWERVLDYTLYNHECSDASLKSDVQFRLVSVRKMGVTALFAIFLYLSLACPTLSATPALRCFLICDRPGWRLALDNHES